jgi:hypothetical protein
MQGVWIESKLLNLAVAAIHLRASRESTMRSARDRQ